MFTNDVGGSLVTKRGRSGRAVGPLIIVDVITPFTL